MPPTADARAFDAFHNAASRVPAYQTILREARVRPEDIKREEDFPTLPVLEKRDTFQRFSIAELCVDGTVGQLGTVLTSSGHSGIFAFGVTDREQVESTTTWVDDSLDFLFAVRSRPTLLVNCLPMGVKVPTRACTLAETSVRPDMVVGLIKSFGRHFAQVIIIGEAAFLKLLLETGKRGGLEWRNHVVQVILGEEPLAESARRYLGGLLGHDPQRPDKGIIFSSMGVAELGLNLFFEVPPVAPLVSLRGLLHDSPDIRKRIFGPRDWVPSLFTYDPRRIFVEFDQSHRLILTTLDLKLRIPLIRYAPGDHGAFLEISQEMQPVLEAHGISWDLLQSLPIVSIEGRGEHASAGPASVYPEAVKEGLYHDAALAELTTGNFRLISGSPAAEIWIQLSPGVEPSSNLEARFHTAITNYVRARFNVTCRPYEQFPSGMMLDYERKFRYVAT